jgi:pSer/pThr/pTyr-binding forkhead associated (FHA) protein
VNNPYKESAVPVMAQLLIKDPAPYRGKNITVAPGRIFCIGSGKQNDFVINEPTVSERHAKIRFEKQKFWLDDLDSAYGTFVNNTVIKTKSLPDGAMIRLGEKFCFAFHYQPSDSSEIREATDELESETVLDVPVDLHHLEAAIAPDTQATQMPVLMMIDEKENCLEKYQLQEPITKVGRTPINHVILDHLSISREHCEFCIKDDSISIRDLNSSNGISINGKDQKVSRVENGDMIRIGSLHFKLVWPENLKKKSEKSENGFRRKRLDGGFQIPESTPMVNRSQIWMLSLLMVTLLITLSLLICLMVMD